MELSSWILLFTLMKILCENTVITKDHDFSALQGKRDWKCLCDHNVLRNSWFWRLRTTVVRYSIGSFYKGKLWGTWTTFNMDALTTCFFCIFWFFLYQVQLWSCRKLHKAVAAQLGPMVRMDPTAKIFKAGHLVEKQP